VLREPKIIEIAGKKFKISKLNAIDGRYIMLNYPLSSVGKALDYSVNEKAMIKLLSFTARVFDDGTELQLLTPELINNHLSSWKESSELEAKMLEYNDFLPSELL
jgi:hypothetical protein